MKNVYIVGAGLFGSVLAERLTSILNMNVVVIEKRAHIGGNCYSFIDPTTGINCHKYGSHIFHTSDQRVIDYIQQFATFNHYRHQVLTRHRGEIYQMPINLSTINRFFSKNFSPYQGKEFLDDLIAKSRIKNPSNFEEQAISLIGKDLYYAFIRGYTVKQWQRDPTSLPAYIINRLPFRTNYCADYFSDSFQGIPFDGYTPLFEKLLSNPLIKVKLNTTWNDIKFELNKLESSPLIIYTGAPDELFDYCYGELEWRTLDFTWEVKDCSDFQGCAVLNEADDAIPYTRTHEFKHYHPENKALLNSNRTVICREFSHEYKKGDIPYYPIDTKRNRDLYEKYKKLAKKKGNILLGGRLGMYRYMDMDKTIASALDTFELCKKILNNQFDQR